MVDRKNKIVLFNGTVKLKIREAVDLKATNFATRHQVGSTKTLQAIDPYISIDIDDVPVARSTTKTKSSHPVWNEEFSTEVRNGQSIGLTVFHDAAIPPDEFIANCTIAFDDLSNKLSSDIWVIIHVQVCTLLFMYITKNTPFEMYNTLNLKLLRQLLYLYIK